MTKTQFIQEHIIRTCPSADKFQSALAHGEWLWAELTKAGYGDKTPQPKQSRGLKDNAYNRLNPRQKNWFDKFWDAFNYKHDKNGAAQRWAELVAPSDEDYAKIIAAAVKEARRELKPGQVRKYAQGWLSDLRWLDYEAPKAKADNSEHLRLNSELVGLKQLYAASPNDSLKQSIEKIQGQLAQLRKR